MLYPFSTGAVSRLLAVTEPQLQDLIRRQKIHPAPPVVAGRRHWHPADIRRAAEALGQDPSTVLPSTEEATEGPGETCIWPTSTPHERHDA